LALRDVGHERHARCFIQCNRCKRQQASLTAGTIFHSAELPLTTWLQAIFQLAQSKGGISSIELGWRLGVRQGTAWLTKHKRMQAMVEREATKAKLGGRVEMDDVRAASAAAAPPARRRLSPRSRPQRNTVHAALG
jgi:hypothetical protein